MTEYNTFNVHSMKNICRACLKLTEEVFSMTPDERIAYEQFAGKVNLNNSAMILCLVCKWMLRKCMKFALQVKKASDVLQEVINMDTKSYVYLHLTNYDMCTTTTTHYLGPDMQVDELSDREDVGMDLDDDEIPLVMLQDFKSRKRKEESTTELEIEIKQELKEESDPQFSYNKRSKKKEIREGFTSRMVQETDEYIVIKLNTEQVLQELSEKAKTESYLRAPYKCHKCVKGFNFEDVLLTHMDKHRQENGSYECTICSQYCPTPVSLRGHMKSHTTRYKCKICRQVRLSRQHLLEHYTLTHTDSPVTYTCEQCEFTSNKRTVIQRHVKSHSASEKHACHTCGKLFNTIESLRVHTMRHDKSKRLQCEHCEKQFIYPSLLHKHISAVHDRKDYYCVECDVNFKSPESLRLHFKKAKRHRDSSSFKYGCTECEQRFVTTASLSVHLTTAHGQRKQHACHICNNHYSSKEALRAHIWRVHSQKKETPANCNYCDKTFTRKSILKVHIRRHTGERAHVCECGAAFSQRASLTAHVNAKHHQKQENHQPSIEVVQAS